MQSTDFHEQKIDVPNAVVDFHKAYVFARKNRRYVDPLEVPADTSVNADPAYFKVVGYSIGGSFVLSYVSG